MIHPRRTMLLLVSMLTVASATQGRAQGPRQAVDATFKFIFDQHDLFHRHFYVYRDRDSGDVHFFPSGWMGDIATVKPLPAKSIVNDNCTEGPFLGRTCIKITYPQTQALPDPENWSALYWQFPDNNWTGKAYDLQKYVFPDEQVRLTFYVRAQTDGPPELSSVFKTGGMKADTYGPIPKPVNPLPAQWTQVSIDVSGSLEEESASLRNVAGGFCWASSHFPENAKLFLDEIRFEFGPKGTAQRLSEPRFVRSYVPSSTAQVDMYFRNAAYCYDNALIVLACCARGKPDDLRHAKLICDAFVYAQEHDEFQDGRLRNVYSCGDLADPSQNGLPRLPGWWDDKQGKWLQDHPYFVSTDCGNMSWVGLALLTYAEHTKDRAKYIKATERICNWIVAKSMSETGPGGYTGGIDIGVKNAAHPDGQYPVTFKSTEHNIDIYPLFKRLGSVTGDAVWDERAEHAARFVGQMINAQEGHLWTGTLPDGRTKNLSPLPLDVNTWALLAFRDSAKFGRAVRWAEKHCAVPLPGGLQGFDFNTDKDAVWFEGTGQMSLCYKLLGKSDKAAKTLEAIRRYGFSRETPGGVLAASSDELTTGFTKEWGDWVYWKRPQTGGATCWYIFGELGWNPYWAEPVRE